MEPEEVTVTRTASYKVPGGKLLKVRLESDNGVVQTITIMGDFFFHPEESLIDLEDELHGAVLEYESLLSRIQSFIEDNNITVIGASCEDFAKLILMAS